VTAGRRSTVPAVGSTLDLLRDERRASVETLRAAGPDASTVCDGWTARDVAGHLLIQDQGGGAPILLTAPIGLPMLRLGVRLPSRFAERMEGQQRAAMEVGWDAALEKLAAGPPRTVAIPVLGSMRFHENWIHHEDVRRASDPTPRPSAAEADDAIWSALRWYGPYQRKVLTGVDLVLQRDDGQELHIGDGDGDRVTAQGPAGELALIVAGRQSVSAADVDGSETAVGRLCDPSVAL